MNIPDLTDLFERMSVSKQQARYRTAILKHGTFGSRTRHYLKLMKGGYNTTRSLTNTLIAYMECIGIQTTPDSQRRMHEQGGHILKEYNRRMSQVPA